MGYSILIFLSVLYRYEPPLIIYNIRQCYVYVCIPTITNTFCFNNDKTCPFVCINCSEFFKHHARRDVSGPDGRT